MSAKNGSGSSMGNASSSNGSSNGAVKDRVSEDIHDLTGAGVFDPIEDEDLSFLKRDKKEAPPKSEKINPDLDSVSPIPETSEDLEDEGARNADIIRSNDAKLAMQVYQEGAKSGEELNEVYHIGQVMGYLESRAAAKDSPVADVLKKLHGSGAGGDKKVTGSGDTLKKLLGRI